MKAGWERKNLGELAEIKGGKRVPKGYRLETEPTKYPYIRVTDFNDIGSVDLSDIHYINEEVFNQIKRYTISSNDLYISIAGTIGKTGIIPKELDGSNLTENACKLVFKKEVDAKFVYYFTKSDDFLKQAGLNTRIAAMPKLALTRLKTISLLIPSLPTQQRIVAILDKAFAAIFKAKDNAEQNLINAKELFESYLQNIFENKGKDWEEKKLGEVLIMPPRNGWSPPAKNHSDYGTPVLTLSSITGFIFKPFSIKYTSAVSNSGAHYWVNNGDLLITRSNTPELVGHVAICSGINVPTIYPDLIMKINPDNKTIMTKFLYYQLRSPLLRQIIMESAHGANPTMKKINKRNVEDLRVSYPVLNMQQSIVKKLDALSAETKRLEAIYQQKLEDLEELKKSILQKAFEGKL